MHRPASSIYLAVFALVGLACSEEEPPYFADGTFGASNRELIEDDCDKRVMCAQRDNPYLREDVFEDCVSTNATNLNSMEEFRFKWRLGVERCKQTDVCQYVACVDSTFVSWGESQRMKIDFACQQKLQCHMESGTLATDPQSFTETCRIQGVIAGDTYLEETRTSYTNTFFACMAQVSCAFVSCFAPF